MKEISEEEQRFMKFPKEDRLFIRKLKSAADSKGNFFPLEKAMDLFEKARRNAHARYRHD